MKKILILVFLLAQSTLVCLENHDQVSRENSKYKLGLFGGFNYNQHSADFYKLNGIPNCCPNFENGDGAGLSFGALYQRKITENFWLSGYLYYTDLGGTLKRREPTTIVIESGPAIGAFEHEMIGDFRNFTLDISLDYNLFADLYLAFGPALGYSINSSFEQSETIVEPYGYGTFVDEDGNNTFSSTRNEFSGDIPDANTSHYHAFGRIYYELPLNRTKELLLSPQLTYYFPINEVVKNTSWNISTVTAGIALKYSPKPLIVKKEVIEEIYEIDTLMLEDHNIADRKLVLGSEVIVEEVNVGKRFIITKKYINRTDTIKTPKVYELSGTINAVGLYPDGTEKEEVTVVMEEFISTRYQPLLNYIFFDENSAKFRSDYKTLSNKQAADFSIDNFHKYETLESYYYILNIVGKRLTENPSANLIITGCNSGNGDEKNNKQLSSDRADVVKRYFLNVWNIEDSRLKVETRGLPENASTPVDQMEKIQENRRVELHSDDLSILEPIFTTDTLKVSNPPSLRFNTDYLSEAGLKKWQIQSYQLNSKFNFDSTGNGKLPSIVDWNLTDAKDRIPSMDKELNYQLKVWDKKDNSFETEESSIPLNLISIRKKRIQKIGDMQIGKYSMILFDFNSSEISIENEKIIDLIKSRVKNNSKISITGYTDFTGGEEYNKRLSRERANSTKNALSRKDAKAIGYGPTNLYDNKLPEGRFYCRTVEVIIETPIEY